MFQLQNILKKCSIDLHGEVTEDSPTICPTATYHPLIDCQNTGQISRLNLPHCGFQPPVLVRPLPAWVNAFLFSEILSRATEGSQVRQGAPRAEKGAGKEGREAQDSVLQTDGHAWTLALSWAVRRAGGRSHTSSKPQSLLSPAAVTSERGYPCSRQYRPRVPPLSIYTLLLRTDGWGCSLGLN